MFAMSVSDIVLSFTAIEFPISKS